MKLYFTPGACSHAVHVALREAGLPFELEKVDLQQKKTASGGDFLAINPKGYVPTLQLDDGATLTEGPVIMQYIADLKPDSGLAPPQGSMDRYREQEWLNFITSELHKNAGALFNPKISGESKEAIVARLQQRLAFVAKRLETNTHLMGERFTAADGYLYTVLSWLPNLSIDISTWPSLKAFLDRVKARPSVKAAREAEGSARLTSGLRGGGAAGRRARRRRHAGSGPLHRPAHARDGAARPASAGSSRAASRLGRWRVR